MRLKSMLACAAVAPLLIAASQPVRLQPSSPWDVDYADNSCRLIRTFGEGQARTVLMFESEAPGNLDMLVVGKGLDSYGDTVSAKFLPIQSKPFEGTPTMSERGRPGALWSEVLLMPDSEIERLSAIEHQRESKPAVRPPPIDLAERAVERAERHEFAARATELEIRARPGGSVVLETGSLGEAIQAFDNCSRDSLRDWGIDPDLQDKIARPVWAPKPASWFSSDDYPPDMINAGEESMVKVRALVDATGRITKCTSLSHFKEPIFNKLVCDRFMKRAKFEPAELADGTKVPSFYINTVIFRIPR
jgi:hypothetical protein